MVNYFATLRVLFDFTVPFSKQRNNNNCVTIQRNNMAIEVIVLNKNFSTNGAIITTTLSYRVSLRVPVLPTAPSLKQLGELGLSLGFVLL